MSNNMNLKPATTSDEQIEILKQRGLIITCDDYAKKVLSFIGYYRLSAYSLGLRDNNRFHDNVTFERIYYIYLFDENLRALLFKTIAPIEIKLRAAVSNHLALKYGNACHLNPSIFNCKDQHDEFLASYKREIQQQKGSQNPFVLHHLDKYQCLPIWVAVEILTMGQLSKFLGNLSPEDRSQIASQFKVSNAYFSGWIRSLCYIRNICAHNGRIYNRVITIRPRLLHHDRRFKEKYAKIFLVILVIARIYQNKGSAWKAFYDELVSLMGEYGGHINLLSIGFPEDWKEVLSYR